MKEYSVYIHTNKLNNKVYIGITCQKPEHRWGKNGNGYAECPYFWNAIQKYGWDNFDHEIQITGLSYEEACEIEIEQIAEKNANNSEFGYNIQKGGDGFDSDSAKALWENEEFRGYASKRMREAWKDPEKRKRRSEATKARWANPEFKERAIASVKTACARQIQCVELGTVYPSIKDAANVFGLSSGNLVRSAKTGYLCGGYHWKYIDSES